MSDNINVQPATGSGIVPLATEFVTCPDSSTAHVTLNKLGYGATGTYTAVTSSVGLPVVGNVASGSADSGDPVKVGGVYNSSSPTLSTGQRGDLQLDASGRLIVNVAAGSSGNAAASATASAVPADADYTGINVSGALRGQTGVNPSGSIYAAQTDLTSVGGSSLAFGQAAMASSIPVAIASNQSAIAVSAASLPLPTGAATSAKQPALGTAGTASADVITVQGITSMVALKVDGSGVTQPVDGTVTANAGSGTFAISAASLPLPTGASTSAKQPALGTAGSASTDVLTVQGITSMTALKVDGSGVTQPISASALPLPTGASTSAKQPALGTAGTASTDVITIQGITSMTAVKVDGSGVTQPISIAAALPAGSNQIGSVQKAADVINIGGTTYTVQKAFVTATSSGNTQVVALTSGKKIRVLSYAIGPVSVACNVYFNSSVSGQISSTKCLAANGGMARSLAEFGHFDTASGEALQINLSTNSTVGVDVLYINV